MAKNIDYQHLTVCHQEAIGVLVSSVASLENRVTELESLCQQQGKIVQRLLSAFHEHTDTPLSRYSEGTT